MNLRRSFVSFSLSLSLVAIAHAELKLPAILSDHMVLQQKQANPIWGWDTPGSKITVSFGGKTQSAEAGADGRWTVKLESQLANFEPQTLIIKGSSEKKIEDILIGEVWMCSGQSNMEWFLSDERTGSLELLTSKLPTMRLIRVPKVGSQEAQSDFVGSWQPSEPTSAAKFSAVGFYFGRYLQQILNVPIGLIDNSWGGSAAEAWVRRSSLESDSRFKPWMEGYLKKEAEMLAPKTQKDYEIAKAKYDVDLAKATAEHLTPPPPVKAPSDWLNGNSRPGNIFNGMLLPTLGYGIKGVIWYQGETNAGNSQQALEYKELFPFMIEQWRKEWAQGDFPFYWCQLADYMDETPQPSESAWAELREAQTQTQSLPNTGQAVIIDLGEGKDIHPRNKRDVAARLVRLALAKDYGVSIICRSPEFKQLEIAGEKATVTFDCFGSSLRAFDVKQATGFALCGEDKVWKWAIGTVIEPDKIELSAPDVPMPIAVRYAWANNPVCNLFNKEGLAATPFRATLVKSPSP